MFRSSDAESNQLAKIREGGYGEAIPAVVFFGVACESSSSFACSSSRNSWGLPREGMFSLVSVLGIS